MTMRLKVAACMGVPESSPVEELKLAHHGLLVIENVSLLRRIGHGRPELVRARLDNHAGGGLTADRRRRGGARER